MGPPGSSDVDPGPPPDPDFASPGPGDSTGSGIDGATATSVPLGTDAAASPRTSSAPPPSSATGAELEPQAAPPTTTNVSVTNAVDDPSSSPSSKAFDDDGDAEMERNQPTRPSAAFTSTLQVATSNTTMTATPPPTAKSPSSKRKPKAQATAIRGGSSQSARASPKPQPAAPSSTTPRSSAVGSKSGTARHRMILAGTPEPPGTPAVGRQATSPALALLEDLECIAKTANLRRDGEQRAMQEVKALCRILARHIDVPELPKFIMETHTGAERDILLEFHRDHLGWRLYLILPPGVTFSEKNAKYHLLYTLLVSCGDDQQARELVQKLFQDVHTILCDPKSQIAVFRFVQREVRDFWTGQILKFNRDRVVLQATDFLTSDITGVGYDEGAREILYRV